MGKIRKIEKFYTQVIIKNVGIFIFIGLLSVLFGAHGWIPNEGIYAVSQLVYQVILPTLLAFEGGRKLGGETGGIQAVLALAGVLSKNPSIGILSALLLGPLSGWLWNYEDKCLKRYVPPSMQMLVKNLCIGIVGGGLAILGMWVFSPAIEAITSMMYRGVQFLISHQLMGALSLVIEPAKVFFLNNTVNHGILVPLGMKQVQESGTSVLYLLETNPGPGMGVLAAFWYQKKEQRNEYGSALFAEAVGGIHEVYFPLVLSEPLLLVPVILGGITGNVFFQMFDAGLEGAVSPGSIIVILLMAGKGSVLSVLAGIFLSALVTFATALLVLRREHGERKKEGAEKMVLKESGRIERLAFVCDGGVGSSAMGAALFRRALAREGVMGIQVEAFAADLVPIDTDLIVCQKDFYRMLPETLQNREIYTVESLVRTEEYTCLIEQIRKRNE